MCRQCFRRELFTFLVSSMFIILEFRVTDGRVDKCSQGGGKNSQKARFRLCRGRGTYFWKVFYWYLTFH